MNMIKPPKLTKGDMIAIISPSAGLAGLFPHRLENAKIALEKLGFKIKIFPRTKTVLDWSSGLPKERAEDLHDAFLNKNVKAIICSIGGLVSNQLLPFINFNIIKKNPKIFCGYSDITILHYAFFTQIQLVTFYGPAALTQFGEYPKPLDYTLKYFLKALATSKPVGKIIPSLKWTDEVLDWSKKDDLKRPRQLKENKGFEWLKEGSAKGQIIGGCLPSILQLKGTKYWINHKNKIFFIEIPEGQDFMKAYSLEYVDSNLTDLELSGIFEQINGLVVGRPYRYTLQEEEKFKKIILRHTEAYSFPILYSIDIGHSDPMITIPLGTEVKLDSNSNSFIFLESGTSE